MSVDMEARINIANEIRALRMAHAEHLGNIQLLNKALPTLNADNAARARTTINNLRNQMLAIDTQLLRYSPSEVA